MRVSGLSVSFLSMSLLSLTLASGCLQFATDMTFLDLQQEPAATGLMAYGFFQLSGGFVAPNYGIVSGASLWEVEGYGRVETVGYEDSDSVWLEPVRLLSDEPGDHAYTLEYGVDGQPHTEPAHVWYEAPAGFGLDLSPWRAGGGWQALEHFAIHRDQPDMYGLRLVSAGGQALIGDGDARVVEDGTGEIGAVDETVSLLGGELGLDITRVEGTGGARVELLDGSQVAVPSVQVLDDYALVESDWSLTVVEVPEDGETSERLFLEVADPSGYPFLFPNGNTNALSADDDHGAFLAAVDGLPNDGSYGCTARFSYDTTDEVHEVSICVGQACTTVDLPGHPSRDEGSFIDCPW